MTPAILVVEDEVPVVRLAFQNVDDAGAAEAFLAAAVAVVAGIQQHVEDGLFRRDREDVAGARDLHLEARAGPLLDVRVGLEKLEMDGAEGPMLAGGGHRMHQAEGPAAVDVGAVLHLGQQGAQTFDDLGSRVVPSDRPQLGGPDPHRAFPHPGSVGPRSPGKHRPRLSA